MPAFDDGLAETELPAQTEVETDVLVVGSGPARSEEHTSELQSRLVISYAVFCLDRKSVV